MTMVISKIADIASVVKAHTKELREMLDVDTWNYVYRGVILQAVTNIAENAPQWSGSYVASTRVSIGGAIDYSFSSSEGRKHARFGGRTNLRKGMVASLRTKIPVKDVGSPEAVKAALAIAKPVIRRLTIRYPVILSNNVQHSGHPSYARAVEENKDLKGAPFLRHADASYQFQKASLFIDKAFSDIRADFSAAAPFIMLGRSV